MVAGSFLPWYASRSSFALFSVVERLEIAPDGPLGLLVRLWPLVLPVLLCGLALLWWNLVRTGLTLVLLAGLYAGAMVAVMFVAPVDPGLGVYVTAAGVVGLIPTMGRLAWLIWR